MNSSKAADTDIESSQRDWWPDTPSVEQAFAWHLAALWLGQLACRDPFGHRRATDDFVAGLLRGLAAATQVRMLDRDAISRLIKLGAEGNMVDEDDKGAPDLVQPGRRFDLRAAFLLRQEQLLATLGVGRAIGGHPVAVGDSAELNWRGMLESILPARYRVSKAFVVDADGSRSDQIDLLIYDRHFSPVLVDVGDYLFIPAEAAYAVLEIKQVMNKETVLYAADKVASVRRLRRTSAPIPYAAGTFEAKQPPDIVGGLLSMDGWAGGLTVPLTDALREVPQGGALDLGCALRVGGFEVASHDGSIEISGSDTALIFFVLRLLKRLQSMATVPAIVYDDYASVLTSSGEGLPE